MSSKLFVDPLDGNVGIGTTVPQAKLHVSGKDMYIGEHTEYASYVSNSSNVWPPSADGRINGVNITALNKRTRTSYAAAVDCVRTWTARASAVDNNWRSVCWAPELSLFVAVADAGASNRVMTSPDGITWTTRTSAADNSWNSVCWASELYLFVAVAYTGTGNRVMTSPDGITWTTRTSAADIQWISVCWASELSLFVAVANTGTVNRVMTSPNGITWTARASPVDNNWRSVCWAPELSLFVVVAESGTDNRVMTSPDGITWSTRTSAANNSWFSVCWASELSLFVAVATSGTGNRVMTSPDGITWTARTSAADNSWHTVCWAPELSLFVAVAYSGTGNRVMTSADGVIWTLRTSAADNSWISVCWAAETSVFVAVAQSGMGNRVMTSAIGMPNSKSVVKALPSQMTVLPNGNVGIGTTNPSQKLHVNGNMQINLPSSDPVYLNLSQNALNVFGLATTPSLTGSGTLSATCILCTDTPYNASSGASIGFVAPGFNFGAGERYLMHGRISGVQQGGTNGYQGALTFETHVEATLYERLRISANGNVGIGTINPDTPLHIKKSIATYRMLTVENTYNAAPAGTFYSILYLSTSTTYHFVGTVAGVGDRVVIFGSGDIRNTNNSYGAISDLKLKQDINDASSQWDDIKNLKVRKYRFKQDVVNSSNAPYHIGLVAQEVEQTSPNLVETTFDKDSETGQHTTDTTKSIKYSILYMKAVKALQEAMLRIEALEAKMNNITQ